MNLVQLAAGRIDRALSLLDEARQQLRHVKNEQHIRLCVAIEEIKEIQGILTDPECTPEILEQYEECDSDG